MKSWKVFLTGAARRDLHRLDEGPRRDASEPIEDLTDDPLSVPAIQLRSHPPGTMRARFHVGYRMVYQISKPERRVIISRIRPRSVAYRGMKNP